MFVGEMGCWIVVAAFSLVGRYGRGQRQDANYRPVRTDTVLTTSEDEEDADSIRSHQLDGGSRPGKWLTLNNDSRRPLRRWRILMLALPACCDIAGTTLMNVGLLFVAASIYQMTRGALVLFVGLFSVIFLRRWLRWDQWGALVLVVLGVAVVGLAGALFRDHRTLPPADEVVGVAIRFVRRQAHMSTSSPDAARTVLGITLIAGAQIFTASQFVLEEWILENYALDPLKVVGWEGVFGFVATIVAMIVLHLTIGRTDTGRYGYFDTKEGWRELTQYRSIGVSSFLIMISIG